MGSTSAGEPSSAMKESPNWVDMPDDLIANILERLGTKEILKSSLKVCRTWRRICKDPAMWRVIDMWKSFDSLDEWDADYVLQTLTKQAIDLSCGELIDIIIQFFATDDLLDHIVLRSNKLKRLCLVNCKDITGSGLSRAVKRLPQLVGLCISFTPTKVEDIEAIGQNCPQLKYFVMDKRLIPPFIKCDDDDVIAIANNMHELRILDLSDSEVTNNGLEASLNGCPHLQSLDVRMCRNLYLDGVLGKLCRERIKDFKHDLTQNRGLL